MNCDHISKPWKVTWGNWEHFNLGKPSIISRGSPDWEQCNWLNISSDCYNRFDWQDSLIASKWFFTWFHSWYNSIVHTIHSRLSKCTETFILFFIRISTIITLVQKKRQRQVHLRRNKLGKHQHPHCNGCTLQNGSTLEADSAYRLFPQSPVSRELRLCLWVITTHIQTEGKTKVN